MATFRANEEISVEPSEFCQRTRVVVVSGKGGVGKTTVSATLATVAALSGLRVLVVDLEQSEKLPQLFSGHEPLSYEESVLAPATAGRAEIRGRALTADQALTEYFDDHGLRRVSHRLSATGTLEVVATAIPGIKDVLVLGKVKQLERRAALGGDDSPDLIVVDGPAAGHALTFLGGARGLVDAVTGGPIRSRAADVMEFLTDPQRCQVMLVTLPEETPVNETIETAEALQARAGVRLTPVVVNGVWPHLELGDPGQVVAEAGWAFDPLSLQTLADAAELRRHRQELQAKQLDRLGRELALPQIRLPFLFTPTIGPADIDSLAHAMCQELRALPTDLTATP